MDPPTQLNNPSMELNVSKEESSNSSNASPLLPHGEAASALIMLVVAVIISLTIVGNVLVIVALRTSRALRVPQNLFLVSLASADILVAALVIPFSLANEVMGYWYFGSTWCACYLALDVLFCTSSIVHLCAISLDRYWSVTEAVSYNLNWRTPLRIKSMIGVVWLISAVISFPPLIMPKQGERECELIDQTWYILSSSIFSFFIPGLIMILVYCKIYKLGGLGRQSESSFMRVEVEESPSSSQSSGINTAHQRRHLTDTQPQPSPAAGHLPMTAVAQMREKHFTFMLAVAMGVFVVFWFPFFFTYSLQALCTESCYIPKALFKVFFWIGYCNSSVNPIVYTIFNMDFRKAFMKNICRTCKRT